MRAGLTVGEVAERSGLSVSALHFYERRGLIRSWRTSGNQRRYARDVLRRVALIRVAQQLGIPLTEMGVALGALPAVGTPSREDWAAMARFWAADLDRRINALQRMRDQLAGCIGCGCLSIDRCALYNPDDRLAGKGAGPILLQEGAANVRR